jgi:hypothetical protein
MRFVKTAIIAGVASAVLAGAAFAAHEKSKMMLVALPDGTVEHIRYTGDVAPQVVVMPAPSPAEMFDTAFGPDSAFAEMDRMAAAMEAHSQAMMREVAALQAQMPAAGQNLGQGQGIVMTNAQGQPVGVMHYSYVSSTTDGNGCTQTIQYSSDGANANQPKVIRTSAGNCGAQAAPSPAIAPAGARPANPVTQTAVPAAKPEPKVIPTSAHEPVEAIPTTRT